MCWMMQSPTNFAFFQTVGEEQKNAIKEAKELLGIIEERGLGEKKFFGGEQIGLTDSLWMDSWMAKNHGRSSWCETD